MRQVKSERLKKLEQELFDLEQWLKLGLVPKKDIERHREEITHVQAKIEEEKERLHFLRESGDAEDFVPPKRPQQSRSAYTEMPTIPDIDMNDSATVSEGSYESSNETQESDNTYFESGDDDDSDEEEATFIEEDEESYFSDKNRWRRGFKEIVDPDANEW